MNKNLIEKFIESNRGVSLLVSRNSGSNFIAESPVEELNCNSIEEFKKFHQKNKNNILIGYFSYDIAYELLDIKQSAKDDLKLPKIHFKAYKNWQKVECSKQESLNIKKNRNKFQSNISEQEYKYAYQKVKKYIKEGDIYQVNLTHRLESSTEKNARQIFIDGLMQNPVNHAAYIEGEDFEVISFSPERFIKIEDDKIFTCPIKGTRPRKKDPKEDEKQRKELIESEKEAAELNMITDLLRNDLGKVSKSGSVQVVDHRKIEKYSNVWHTHSKITGELKIPPVEALISMLPGGSITGCPKKRACEIIDELEKNARGIYTGVIGYIHPNGNLDFNIAIRTIIKKKNKVYLQVGGGIVHDSTEESEYQETFDKAKSITGII